MDTLIVKAGEFVKEHKLTSWGQKENGRFFHGMIEELIAGNAPEATQVALMVTASNASAFRQRLESAGIVPKGQGRKTGADIFAEYLKE